MDGEKPSEADLDKLQAEIDQINAKANKGFDPLRDEKPSYGDEDPQERGPPRMEGLWRWLKSLSWANLVKVTAIAIPLDAVLIVVHFAAFKSKLLAIGVYPPTLCDSGVDLLCDTWAGDVTFADLTAAIVAMMSVVVPIAIYGFLWHRRAWTTIGSFFATPTTKNLAILASALMAMVLLAESNSLWTLVKSMQFHRIRNPDGTPFAECLAITTLLLSAQHICAALTGKIYASLRTEGY